MIAKFKLNRTINIFFFLLLISNLAFIPEVNATNFENDLNNAISQLDLKPNQKEQIQKILDKQTIDLKSLKQSLKTKQNDLNDLLLSENSSEENIQALRLQIETFEAKINKLNEETNLQIKHILNPQQRKKLRNILFR
jgi:Spy/CpxP family protein refolding chaperone